MAMALTTSRSVSLELLVSEDLLEAAEERDHQRGLLGKEFTGETIMSILITSETPIKAVVTAWRILEAVAPNLAAKPDWA